MKNYRPPLLFPRFWRASECDVLGASAPVVPDEKKSAPDPPHRPTRGCSHRASNAVFVWATKSRLAVQLSRNKYRCSVLSIALRLSLPLPVQQTHAQKGVCPLFLRSVTAGRGGGGGGWRMQLLAKQSIANKQKIAQNSRRDDLSPRLLNPVSRCRPVSSVLKK